MKFAVNSFGLNGLQTTQKAATRKAAKKILRNEYNRELKSNVKILDSSIGTRAYRILSEQGSVFGVIEKL